MCSARCCRRLCDNACRICPSAHLPCPDGVNVPFPSSKRVRVPFTPCRGAGGVPALDGANGTLGRSEATNVPFTRSEGAGEGTFR